MAGSSAVEKEKEKEKWPGGDDVGALVIDLGSHSTRIGYAGDDAPKQLWESLVGLPTSVPQDAVSVENYIFPLNLHLKRDNVDVRPALFHTGSEIGFDCDAFERIVRRCCGKQIGLGVDLEGKPVMLTEPSRHYKALRSKMVELMFEQFQTEAVYVAKNAVLSTFASGKSAGCVVDVGAMGTCVTPVQDGYTLQRSMSQFRVGGNLLENELGTLLAEKGYALMPKFSVKASLAPDAAAAKETRKGRSFPVDCSGVTNSYMEYGKRQTVRDTKVAICRCAEDNRTASVAAATLKRHVDRGAPAMDSSTSYELPDGTPIQLAEEFGMCAAEILFSPQQSAVATQASQSLEGFLGVPHAIFNCISQCDVDLRKELLSSIILTGGTTLTPGFPDRVQRELQEDERLFGNTTKFKIVSHSATIERHFSSWIGGSILASLGTFQQMWMSRYEYNEHGSDLVERKCMQ